MSSLDSVFDLFPCSI